jgi:hypothetical protein
MKKKNHIIRLLKENIISQNGMALAATLIFVVVLTTFGIAMLTMTRNDIKLAVLQEESTKAFYLADAGVERAINWLEKQPSPPKEEDLPPEQLGGNHVFEELGTGKYTVNITPDTSAETIAGYNVNSIGWITRADGSDVTKEIETLLAITNFAQYAYFSDEERFPNNYDIPGAGGYAGQTIWFTGNDTFGGRLHSNSQLHIVDVPDFMGKVTSTEDTIDFWGNAFLPDGSDFPSSPEGPGFRDGYELGVDEIPLPQFRNISDLDDENSLQRIAGGSWDRDHIEDVIDTGGNAIHIPSEPDGMGNEVATGGIYVKGTVNTIELDVDNTTGSAGPNSQIAINQSGTTTIITSIKEPKTLTLTIDSIVNETFYPAGSTIDIPNNTTLLQVGNEYTIYNGYTNGLLFVDGAINSLEGENHRGKMSIATTQSINITDNIYYYDRDESLDLVDDDIANIEDSLGLISAKDIIIDYIAPYDIEVDAIIMALDTSFFYERWQNLMRGTLSLLGGLIQKQRGPVGTHNAGVKVTGYSKEYVYDTRMANPASGYLPPYFPSTGKYEKAWWKEVY